MPRARIPSSPAGTLRVARAPWCATRRATPRSRHVNSRLDPDPPAPRSGDPLRARLHAGADAAVDFVRRVYEKAAEDNIFFMAGAIAFNVIVAFIPLFLAMLGIAGTILRLQHADPTEALMQYVLGALPAVSDEFQLWIRGILQGIVDRSAGLLGIGTFFLVWFATRLVGTLRTALREVFDIQFDRGIVAGKLFDIKMVIAAGTLLALNVGLTVVLELVANAGVGFLGLGPGGLEAFELLYGRLVAFLVIWFMFVLIYRYLPARRIAWSTAIVAATFAAVVFELMKEAFSWYVTDVAVYRSTYGSLATLIILVFWVYYTAVAFILGGEVAQVAAMQRIRRRQKERLR